MKTQKYSYQIASAFSVGFIFAVGLAISGMTEPQKVISFLDLAGKWNPALMFVMMGAIPVHYLSYLWIKGQKSPLLDTRWHYPTSRTITKQLVIGSAIFGIGWGLGGLCPGPAIASVAARNPTILIFVISMTAGMYLHHVYENLKKKIHERKRSSLQAST